MRRDNFIVRRKDSASTKVLVRSDHFVLKILLGIGLGKRYCYGSMEGEYCHCDYCRCKHGYGLSGHGNGCTY